MNINTDIDNSLIFDIKHILDSIYYSKSTPIAIIISIAYMHVLYVMSHFALAI